jgi:cell shape-determining protein MreD
MLLDMSLVLSLVSVLIATILQDMIPATALLPVKGYFLTAVAAYYVLEKPRLMSVVVVIWAGILTDVLGGLPHGCTLVFLLVIYAFLLLLKRILVEATILHGTVLMAILSMFQQVWTHVWVRHTGIQIFSMDMLKLAGCSALLGLLTGFSMFLLCTWLERFKGVVDRTSTDVEGMNGIV